MKNNNLKDINTSPVLESKNNINDSGNKNVTTDLTNIEVIGSDSINKGVNRGYGVSNSSVK